MKEKAEKPVKATPIQIATAVFWAFFGVRKKSDHAADVESLTLGQVVIGGVIGAALFVGSLLLLVNFMTS
ncbi:MAG: DUF2970 domain-containing protein [Betaproteobacteria bacterium]|nr:DUF2970 domain-containing protein [Betaproteobacteria bacterium]